MELPPLLRRAVDRMLDGTTLTDLAAAANDLSQRYREEQSDGKAHVASDRDALAYLAVRLPATYAAVRATFAAIAEASPDFAPKTALDVGTGPGTALWAAADCWPALDDALLIEASPVFRVRGEQLAAEGHLPHITWRNADVAADDIDSEPRDLVTMAYVLNELDPELRQSVLQNLWRLTADTLVIVEPGTPAGWQRISRCTAPADRGRRPRDCAMPACQRVPAAVAGLVPFCPARRPLALAPASQRCGRPLGGRKVQLRSGLAKAGAGYWRARHCPSAKSQRPCHAEAVPSRWIGRQPIVLAPRRRIVQARVA